MAYGESAAVTHEEVRLAVALSGAAQLASVLEAFAFEETWFPYVFLGTVTLQSLPGLAFGAEDAPAGAAVQLAADALSLGNYALFGDNYVNPLLFNAAHKFSMYRTYALYADLRSRCAGDAYASSFSGRSFLELVSAPFRPSVLGEPYVWGTIATVAAVTAVSVATSDQSRAVWATGKCHLNDAEIPLWAGVSLSLLSTVVNYVLTGVGEESLYRGVYYEETKTTCGPVAAKILDANYFVLSHYPQQYGTLTKTEIGTVILNYALSLGNALWLQCVYDWGGLPASVAVHAWNDVLFGMADWLLAAGVPYLNDAGFDLMTSTRAGVTISWRAKLP